MKKLQINLFLNFKIENRVSMDVASDIASEYIKKFNKNVNVNKIIPKNFFITNYLKDTFLFKYLMRIERYIHYPLQVKKLKYSDISIIIDHQYAHLAKKINSKFKYIYVNDLVPFIFKRKLNKFPYLLNYSMSFLKYFDAVFAISNNTRRDIIKFTNCPKKKIIVSYLSIENFFNSQKINKVNICKKYNIPFKKKKILVHLSRGKTNQNYFIKNPEIVFKTINLLLKKNKNLIFINLGGKIDFSENKNLKKHFHILPFLKRQDLPEIYKICDILFFPSIYEGFGLPLLESMKCGLPIVSSDNSSIPEIVGDSAILHKKNDHVSFANSIENLLKNKSLRNKLIKNGFKQSKKFDPNKIYKFV